MVGHYVRAAWRQISGNRLYSAINIFGLGTALAAGILIMLFVKDELSYDQYLPNTENVYRLDTIFTAPNSPPNRNPTTQRVMLEYLQQDFAEIAAITQLVPLGSPTLQIDDKRFNEITVLADPNLFDVLDFPIVAGNGDAALGNINSVILSETAAAKIFGGDVALGEIISMRINNKTRDYIVGAIMRDIPDTSHIRFDVILPFDDEYFPASPFGPTAPYNWVNFSFLSYLKFEAGASLEVFNSGTAEFIDRHVPPDIAATLGGIAHERFSYVPVQLQDIHLYGAPFQTAGSPATLIALASIAALVLGIGSANFVNLATARNLKRAKEVGIRKVVGAKRHQLIAQFLSESTLTVFLAVFVSAILVELFLPFYREFLTYSVGAGHLSDPVILAGLVGLVAVVGLGAGSYPAFILSSFRPAQTFNIRPSASASKRLRSALVVIQFTIAIGLAISTGILYAQTSRSMTKNLGFDMDDIIIVRGLGGNNVPQRETFLTRLRALNNVENATNSNFVPGDGYPMQTRITLQGESEQLMVGYIPVGFGFFETYGVIPITGRIFSEEFSTDPVIGPGESQQRAVANTVINETAALAFGFATPAQALGKTFTAGINFRTDFTIVGVVQDIRFADTRQEIRPDIFVLSVNGGTISIRHRANDLATITSAIDNLWAEMMPERNIVQQFLDDNIAQQYQQDDTISTMIAAFATLAVIVSSLGLYGLAAFDAEQRTKEIGLRKIMGARIPTIVKLLVWQFSKPVLLANLFAWPIVWLVMSDWLDGFVYRIEISPLYFIVAGVFSFIIASLTVGGHALKVSRTSPIHALRYE
jgi:putative ABC transport system permease protein